MASRKAAHARTQVERSETTQAELIAAARALFARDGYAGTLLDEVAAQGRVTKGALYHHFAGKRELFEAVFEREHRHLAELGARAYAAARDPRTALYEACRSFLEASLDPAIQRITVLDAPAVLGWERVREIEDRSSLVGLRKGLEAAIAMGFIAPRNIEPLVYMLNGAMCEAAMFIAKSPDPKSALHQALAELRTMLDALASTKRKPAK